MTFASYRDPSNLETFDNFKKAVELLQEGKIKDIEIDEAK